MTKYKFKGYTITNCGYHQPDHCVWWEAVDENGEACFHGNTLREVEFMILDYEWEQKMRRRDEEIEKLKASTVGNAASMRDALEEIDKNTDLLDIAEDLAPDIFPSHSVVALQIRKIVRAALAAPPRNCDVGTVDEQERRYEKFCDSHKWVDDEGANACSPQCPLHNVLDCALRWAQMPFDSKGKCEDVQ